MRLIAVIAIATLATLVLAWSSGSPAAGGEGGLISVDKSLFIQMINFLVLLFILWKLLYKPLVAKMEERSSAIRQSLEEAQAARLEAQRERERTRRSSRPLTRRPRPSGKPRSRRPPRSSASSSTQRAPRRPG